MKIPNNPNFTVIVEHIAEAYTIPQDEGIQTQIIWDGSNVEEILELEHPGKSQEEIGDIRLKIYEHWKTQLNPEHYFRPSGDYEFSTYFGIRFLLPKDRDFERLIKDYLNDFREYLEGLWENRGGDDDYYDYLPSITDIYYELCLFFEAPEEWDIMRDLLVSMEGEDVLTDSLYRY